MRRLLDSTRWRFVVCVAVSNLLSGLLSLFLRMPLASRILPPGHVLAPWIPVLFSIVLALPISSFVSRRSARPIQDMVEATKAISRADTRTICGVSKRWEATPSSTALASAS